MKKTERYLALDVLRGITVAGMILVNTPGSWSYVYPPLRHAEWHGCTPTDLVFPFFLFVVGVSVFFSFLKYGNTLNKESLLKVGKRTVLIFAIGLFLNSFPQWDMDYSTLRIMGVLQRIALAYGIGALLVLSLRFKPLLMVSGGLLLLHWALLYYLGGSAPYSLEQNVTIPFDSFVLGESHMYHGFGIPFDPEGLFSTLSAVVTVIVGYAVGHLIKASSKKQLPTRLLLVGGALALAGWLWSFALPLNKPMWTGSYVLYTGGLATMFLSLLVWLIDVRGYKKWTSFFIVFGMNPLFIFAFSGLWAKILGRVIKITTESGESMSASKALYENIFVPLAGNMNGSLLYALTHIVFFWFLGWILYKKKIFIKV